MIKHSQHPLDSGQVEGVKCLALYEYLRPARGCPGCWPNPPDGSGRECRIGNESALFQNFS